MDKMVPSETAALMEKHLSVLRQQFLSSLVKKELELEDALSSVAAYGPSREHLARLFYIAHNIVGVAPTHRLHTLASVAGRAEALLARAVLPPHASIDLSEVLLSADDLADEIRNTIGENTSP